MLVFVLFLAVAGLFSPVAVSLRSNRAVGSHREFGFEADVLGAKQWGLELPAEVFERSILSDNPAQIFDEPVVNQPVSFTTMITASYGYILTQAAFLCPSSGGETGSELQTFGAHTVERMFALLRWTSRARVTYF